MMQTKAERHRQRFRGTYRNYTIHVAEGIACPVQTASVAPCKLCGQNTPLQPCDACAGDWKWMLTLDMQIRRRLRGEDAKKQAEPICGNDATPGGRAGGLGIGNDGAENSERHHVIGANVAGRNQHSVASSQGGGSSGEGVVRVLDAISPEAWARIQDALDFSPKAIRARIKAEKERAKRGR